jgi:hypothetical protein
VDVSRLKEPARCPHNETFTDSFLQTRKTGDVKCVENLFEELKTKRGGSEWDTEMAAAEAYRSS